MRVVRLAMVIWIPGLALALALAACSDEPIGQPCAFSWPLTETSPENVEVDCHQFPTCAPLQNTGQQPQEAPANDNCPVDCIQLPSLECTNLICVATQVEEPSGDLPKEQLMNGQCSADLVTSGRATCEEKDQSGTVTYSAPYGCEGYCTKECLSDASCPKGYRCAPMAPFGENLRCEDEAEWGGDVEVPESRDTRCTEDCLPAGADLGEGKKCPSSIEGDPKYVYDYALCDQKAYNRCCACMCYRFCPLLTKKFCRKIAWDQNLFPAGSVPRDELNCSDE
jgi:hypothetical protein